MPILGLGVSERGFTLIELLVVIVVLSIAAGLIVIRGQPDDSNYLEADAQKLVQLLRIAQQEALLKSKDIRFIAGNHGYSFEEFTGSAWVSVTTEPLLAPRLWSHGPIQVVLMNAGLENRFLTLRHQASLQRQSIVLQKNQTKLVLQTQRGGLFRVIKPEVSWRGGIQTP